jgi:phosphotransacetylase
MSAPTTKLADIIDRARQLEPVRVAIVDAAQRAVVESLREAHEIGLGEPRLIGDPQAIKQACEEISWNVPGDWIVAADTDTAMAVKAIELVRTGAADVVMKGHIHTDALMHALLDKERGLRMPGRRVSHVFLIELSSHPKLLGVTDAAINIAPDLNARDSPERDRVLSSSRKRDAKGCRAFRNRDGQSCHCLYARRRLSDIDGAARTDCGRDS